MTIDFADKLGTFVIISQKLDGIQRDIAYAFNMPVFKDNNLTCSYWKQPHIYALSKLETRIQDAKRITENYIQTLKNSRKEEIYNASSYIRRNA